MKKLIPALTLVFLVTIIIEGLYLFDYWDAQLVPPFSVIVRTIIENQINFIHAFKETLVLSLKSLLISFLLGSTLALIFSLNSWIKSAVFPVAIFFQTVPIIAIAPLLVIYFGYGPQTIMAAAVFVSVFPILASTLIGLDSTDKHLLELFKVYKLGTFKTLYLLKIPGSYNFIYSGLKISSGLSIIGVVSGEFVAGGGLGSLIDSSRTQQRIDLVFACLIGLAVIGLFQITILSSINLLILRLRPFRL